jgi:uncharacterized protein with PQ loop repeat
MSWMLLPVPTWIGEITLLNRVPPERMSFAAGLLLLVFIFQLYKKLGISSDSLPFKSFIYFSLAVGGWLIYGYFVTPHTGPTQHTTELIAPLFAGLALVLFLNLNVALNTALLVAGVLANVLVFARFNAIQSAHPIFNEPTHLLARTLQAHVNAQGILTVQKDGLIGATLNGMGFRAISHLNATPQWSFWNTHLNSLNIDEKKIMNRYAHIRITPSDSLELLENDQVGVPSKYFRDQPSVSISHQFPNYRNNNDGLIEKYETHENKLVITGWSYPASEPHKPNFLVVTKQSSSPIQRITVSNQERWDRVKVSNQYQQFLTGFVITIHFHDTNFNNLPICIFTRNAESYEWHKLDSTSSIFACTRH